MHAQAGEWVNNSAYQSQSTYLCQPLCQLLYWHCYAWCLFVRRVQLLPVSRWWSRDLEKPSNWSWATQPSKRQLQGSGPVGLQDLCSFHVLYCKVSQKYVCFFVVVFLNAGLWEAVALLGGESLINYKAFFPPLSVCIKVKQDTAVSSTHLDIEPEGIVRLSHLV